MSVTCDGPMAARASSAISEEVSKPRPKRKPRSTIFHSVSMALSSHGQQRAMSPPWSSCVWPWWPHEPKVPTRFAMPTRRSKPALTAVEMTAPQS